MKITKDSAEGLLLLAAGIGAAYVLWRGYAAATGAVDSVANIVSDTYNAASDAISNTAQAVNNAVNPTKDSNWAYQAASIPAKVLTGDKNATYGTTAYDYTHTNGKADNAVVAWFDNLLLN